MGNILKCFLRCLDGEDDDDDSGGAGRNHYTCRYRPSSSELHYALRLHNPNPSAPDPPPRPRPPAAAAPLSHHGFSTATTVGLAGTSKRQHDLLSFDSSPKVYEGPRQHNTSRNGHLKWCVDEKLDNGPYCRPDYHHEEPLAISQMMRPSLVPNATSQMMRPSLVPNGVDAFKQDIIIFAATSLVPEGLTSYVSSSRKKQVAWYSKILAAYKNEEPPPRTSADVAILVATALSRIQRANLEGVLAFYGFPIPPEGPENHPSPIPEDVLFVLHTLPVNGKCVVDGDGFMAYVDTADPIEVREDFNARGQGPNSKRKKRANALQLSLQNAEQKTMFFSGREIVARKYDIRLRGIDAPEMEMQYGKESQSALVKLIARKSVRLHVYGQDQFKRYVCDIYCGGVFIQKQMLLNGHAWHFKTYDKRPEFANWEEKAQAAGRGLWAYDSPEKPWEWRKNKRKAKA